MSDGMPEYEYAEAPPKRHRRLEVTRSMLKKLEACPNGIRAMRRYLPARLSTDPEQNIALAMRIHNEDDDGQDRVHNVRWLWGRVAGRCPCPGCMPELSESVRGCRTYELYEPHQDPYVTAQILAWIADATLALEGL